ncbi:unnamed protein product [Auanema sp. JU1783]|nr:unnamed protein product [Auanema sp. JU1783]
MKFEILFLLVSFMMSQSLRISPESPADFSIQLCSPQRRQKTHGHMQYFPMPIKYCASIRSSKQRRHLINELRGTTSHESVVKLRWRQVASSISCHMAFKGYQSEYRLTPDFGAYETCQFSLSRHVYDLSELISRGNSAKKTRLHFNSTNAKCPIMELPTSYTDYISCSLIANEWYILEWDSSIRYESFRNGSYGNYWSNYSTNFVFQPTDQLNRNGTETKWLSRLLTIDTKIEGCDKASALVLLDSFWPLISKISVVYRVIHHNTKKYEKEIFSNYVDKWSKIDFNLNPLQGTHEICAHLSTANMPVIRQKICKIVIDELDCPYSSSAYSVFSLIGLLTCFLYL